MGIFFLIIKSLLIISFLAMFLRTSKPAWGVGLLTVTSAILLDAFLGTLGQEAMVNELGFFYYIVIGFLFSGAAAWFWVIVKPFVSKSIPARHSIEKRGSHDGPHDELRNETNLDEIYSLLLEELLTSLTYEDLQDLVFDLDYQYQDESIADDRKERLAKIILNHTKDQWEFERLRAAIDRIKSPIPAGNLPRLEKLNSKTPPTILRHYLLDVFSSKDLDDLRQQLEIENSRDERKIKKRKVRQLLSDLYDRNEISKLIEFLQSPNHEDDDVNDEIQD